MLYNNELQKIDTPDKAYLLGLFYADGNISKNQHHTRLALVDEELIIKLSKKFSFFNYYTSNYNEKQDLHILHSGVKILRKHFIDNGCFPAKSFENKSNLIVPFRNNLTRHFIRGYFDGDGGCTLIQGKTKQQKRVYIYSNSLTLLKSMEEYLLDNEIKNSITLADSVYKLTIKVESYKEFYSLLYEESTLYLERKKALFSRILETNFFIQKEAPSCKFCNLSNTVFNGNYIYKNVIKPRVLCKNCNKNFTI